MLLYYNRSKPNQHHEQSRTGREVCFVMCVWKRRKDAKWKTAKNDGNNQK
jgi:hypothetical protein